MRPRAPRAPSNRLSLSCFPPYLRRGMSEIVAQIIDRCRSAGLRRTKALEELIG